MTGVLSTGAGVRGAGLATRAAAVLRANGVGSMTRAAPALYPHQWSWDAAFVSVGLAHLEQIENELI